MKRFTETTKWDDPWYRRLKPDTKLFWLFLCDRCDPAGVWDLDEPVWQFFSGSTANIDEMLIELNGRVVPHSSDKLRVPQFIRFQYGTLNDSCKPHQQVFKFLEKHGLSEEYAKGLETLMDKDKDKDKDMDKEKDYILGGIRKCNEDNAKRHAILNDLSEQVLEIYNSMLGDSLPKAQKLNTRRRRLIKSRLRVCKNDLEAFRTIFGLVKKSNFLMGKSKTDFRARLDWILEPRNWDKILEETYSPTKATKAHTEADHEKSW